MIDTDWFIGCKRAKIAGIMLAEVLLNREHGGRPVTLIGCSLGGRVLLACLEEMSRRHEMWEQKEAMGREGIACSPADFREAKCAAGIVDAAILLGAPVDTDPEL
jgi:predicted alpha/beta-fold hydrolase